MGRLAIPGGPGKIVRRNGPRGEYSLRLRKARKRSPTAADLAAPLWGVHADFVGLSADSDECLSAEQIEWADVVAVMKRRRSARLDVRFRAWLLSRRVICPNLPDRDEYMAPELIRRLEPQLKRILRASP